MGTLEADEGGSGVAVVSLGGTALPARGTVLLLADGSQRVRLDKEHFIEVINSVITQCRVD